MTFDFDEVINRRNNNSDKWTTFDIGTLPMWIADMDFKSPKEVQEGLMRLSENGVYGYGKARPARLLDSISYRMKKIYGWEFSSDAIVLLPSLKTGLNVAANMVKMGNPEANYLTTTPIYPPFLAIGENVGIERRDVPLTREDRGTHEMRFTLEEGAIRSALDENSALFMLCDPHNPSGRVFTEEEQKRLERVAIDRDLIVISDEIHGELLLEGNEHRPYALLSQATREHTITLYSASKTFNIPGLGGGFAIIENEALRERFISAMMGFVPRMNIYAMKATELAFDYGDEWLNALRHYLTANRDYVVEELSKIEGLRFTIPEATYLMWLDFNGTQLGVDAYKILLKNKIALNNGATFGENSGYVRLNFATPRSTLMEGISRILGCFDLKK